MLHGHGNFILTDGIGGLEAGIGPRKHILFLLEPFQGLTFFMTSNHLPVPRLNVLHIWSPSFGLLIPYFEVLPGLFHGVLFWFLFGCWLVLVSPALTSNIAFSYLLLMILEEFDSLSAWLALG